MLRFHVITAIKEVNCHAHFLSNSNSKIISKNLNDSLRTNLKIKTPERKNPRKRALQFSLFQASMTVEACAALPLFLFAVFFVLFFLEVIRIQMEVGSELHQIAKEISAYGYFYGRAENVDIISDNFGTDLLTNVLSDVYVSKELKSTLEEEDNEVTYIKNGEDGIGFYLSSYMEDDIINIVATYQIEIPFSYFIKKPISVMQKARVRAWTGYDGEHDTIEGEQMVYITPNGSVYHLDPDCSYLSPSTKTVAASEIDSMRNLSGAKYYPCEICGVSAIQNGTVYITEYGNRYHTSLECSGLKRNILVVPISQAGGRKACSKCGGE